MSWAFTMVPGSYLGTGEAAANRPKGSCPSCNFCFTLSCFFQLARDVSCSPSTPDHSYHLLSVLCSWDSGLCRRNPGIMFCLPQRFVFISVGWSLHLRGLFSSSYIYWVIPGGVTYPSNPPPLLFVLSSLTSVLQLPSSTSPCHTVTWAQTQESGLTVSVKRDGWTRCLRFYPYNYTPYNTMVLLLLSHWTKMTCPCFLLSRSKWYPISLLMSWFRKH